MNAHPRPARQRRTHLLPVLLCLALAGSAGIAQSQSTVTQALDSVHHRVEQVRARGHVLLRERAEIAPVLERILATDLTELREMDRQYTLTAMYHYLSALGPHMPVGAIGRDLYSTDRFRCGGAIVAAHFSGRKDLVPVLLEQLGRQDDVDKAAIADALGALGSADALPLLTELLRADRDSWKAGPLLRALTDHGDASSLETVRSLLPLADDRAGKYKSAIRRLETATGPDAPQRLLAIVSGETASNDPTLWPWALGRLVRQGGPGVAASLRRLAEQRKEAWTPSSATPVPEDWVCSREMQAIVDDWHLYRLVHALHTLGAEVTDDERRILVIEGLLEPGP